MTISDLEKGADSNMSSTDGGIHTGDDCGIQQIISGAVSGASHPVEKKVGGPRNRLCLKWIAATMPTVKQQNHVAKVCGPVCPQKRNVTPPMM